MVPQGGLFWDGRADTLQDQALGPLLSPIEMDGGGVATVAAKLRRAPYAPEMARLFGAAVFAAPRLAVSEALFAVARYQIEDPGFHPYTSKFDFWLEGKARLTQAELRGYRLFNDPDKANCGGCHLDQPRPDGLPPLFTDGQFEALGAPRNPALTANRDKAYFDLGVCGPYRTDMRTETQFCGMFLHPDAAQRGDAACVLSQRRVPLVARRCRTFTITGTPILDGFIRKRRTAPWRNSTIFRWRIGAISTWRIRRSTGISATRPR